MVFGCGAREWEKMLTEKLDMILRVFYNVPDIKDTDKLDKWLLEVAKVFWTMKQRELICPELDKLCGRAGSARATTTAICTHCPQKRRTRRRHHRVWVK